MAIGGKIQLAAFVDHAFALARVLKIRTVLILANELPDLEIVARAREGEEIVWVTRGEPGQKLRAQDHVVSIPATHLSRVAQIRLGLYAATWSGHVGLAERVVCLSGRAASRRLDMLVVTRPKDDFPWLDEEGLERTRNLVGLREFGRLLELASRFGSEGREGKPIGTTFVIGDSAEIDEHSHQLILNPCAGHAAALRSIHNPDFTETLRELSALDGAIVVNRKGIVVSAGTYLDAPSGRRPHRPGWGARHAAAAGMTAVADCVAIVVSESSGAVTVFDDGRPVLELDQLRAR